MNNDAAPEGKRPAREYAEGFSSCLRIIRSQKDALPEKKKLVFRNQATEIATFVNAGGIEKEAAVSGLSEAGTSVGIDPVSMTAIIADVFKSEDESRPNFKAINLASDWPQGYRMTQRGLVWCDAMEQKPEQWLAGRFEILAETRDTDGRSWGVLLCWKDHDGREHRLALARSSLAGDGADARRVLLDGGLSIAPGRGARDRLTAFLTVVQSSNRMTATSRIGWHGNVFVLPDRSVGPPGGEEVFLQGFGLPDHSFRQRGTLPQWQDEVARLAVGNSRLGLAISAAFAAALVGPCEAENGGIHLRGASSMGKSTALAVGGSVWGGPGYVRSWRATANGLESVALGHCDALLCLDELSQVPAREAGEVAYMLANGAGKSRSSREGNAKRIARWRVLFLSSGEIGLADKVAEDGRGKRVAAGQQVRIVDVQADAGAGLGLFEALHGFSSAEALATHLRASSQTVYGVAAPHFLQTITSDLDRVRGFVRDHSANFVAEQVPDGADGQVYRVAQRFALIAGAGELATETQVLPWQSGEASRACALIYREWLAARGDAGPAEISNAISNLRAFLLAQGLSRFVAAWDAYPGVVPRDVAGFRKREGDGWDYFLTTSAWREEVCRGFDSRGVAQHLAGRGWLLTPGSGLHRAKSVAVPGHGKIRLYHIAACFLEADTE